MARLEDCWYSRNPVALTLWPLGRLYRAVAMVRRRAYRVGLLPRQRVGVPVVVVGNITVGGTGKTPLITRLVELLGGAGYRPGVVSRGYGGRSGHWPRPVFPDSDPTEVGDEPLLLARRCGCPVVVGPDRPAAAAALLKSQPCDLLLSDDGLQHYALERDMEIVVVDGLRRLGNGWCLPAGPLREPPSRLAEVDFVVGNGAAQPGEYLMRLKGDTVLPVDGSEPPRPLTAFRGGQVRAVAGIGHPARFFHSLRAQGLELLEHPFPDHYSFRAADLDFGDDRPILMTEKDAVKCQGLAPGRAWYLPVRAELDPDFETRLLARLDACRQRI